MRPDTTHPRPSRRWLAATCILAALTHLAAYFISGMSREDQAPGPREIAGEALHPGDPVYLDSGSRSPDEREYLYLAVNLARSGELRLPDGVAAKRMPLYPFLLSLVYRAQPERLWHGSALFLQTVMAWCTTVMIALIGWRIADARAGLLAGLTAALYAPFLYVQMLFLTETLSMFLLVAAALVYIEFGLRSSLRKCDFDQSAAENRRFLAFLGRRGPLTSAGVPTYVGIKGRRRPLRSPRPDRGASQGAPFAGLVVVSILLGLAILARPNAVLLLIPFAVDAALRKGAWRGRALRVGLILAPALVCACGWAWRNERAVGRFGLSTSGGLNFHLGHNASYARRPGMNQVAYDAFDRLRNEEGLSEDAADRELFAEGLRYLREQPGQSLLNAVKKVRVWLRPTTRSFGPTLLVLVSAVIVSAGAATRRQARLDRPRNNLWLAALGALALSVLASAAVMLEEYAPWTSAAYVVALGVPALLFMRTSLRVRGLFLGLVGCQLLAAVAFVPLSRLRWTIDWVFIVAIDVVAANVCAWLAAPPPPEGAAAARPAD